MIVGRPKVQLYSSDLQYMLHRIEILENDLKHARLKNSEMIGFMELL